MAKSVVLVSGGLDSCVTASIASKDSDLFFLHVNYGQKTERKELECFYSLSEHFEAKDNLVADVNFLKDIGNSSLTSDSIDVEEGVLNRKSIPNTYVPFRNGNILSVGVSWAESIGAEKIYIGAVAEDSSGYPDCRKEFYDAFNNLLNVGLKPETSLRVETPIIEMDKMSIIRYGLQLNSPFHLTWSCYKSEDPACGECDSCLLRLRGFQKAGVKDPLEYRMRKT